MGGHGSANHPSRHCAKSNTKRGQAGSDGVVELLRQLRRFAGRESGVKMFQLRRKL